MMATVGSAAAFLHAARWSRDPEERMRDEDGSARGGSRVTKYRVGRPRRPRRLVAIAAAGLFVVLVIGLPLLLLDGADEPDEPALLAEPSPSPRARVSANGRVEVRTGKVAVLRCTVEGEGVAPLNAVLEITRPGGQLVERIPLRTPALPGRALLYRWKADVEPGSYRYAVVLEDPTGAAQLRSRRGKLVVTSPPGFPSEALVRAALEFASARAGRVSVAVIDTNGRLYGLDEHERFTSASLVKAMLLVEYLRLHPEPDPSMDEVLRRMITESDNVSADRVMASVGEEGLRRLAERAGMQDFISSPQWIASKVSTADQARFFMDLETYVPKARRAFVRELLSGITPRQRWGIVAASGPLDWDTHFKAGWMNPGNWLVVQAAWLERGERRFSLAVMTEGNPDWTYGFGTLKGVTGVLLGQEPTPVYLAQILEP
jgi:hypothetical protein